MKKCVENEKMYKVKKILASNNQFPIKRDHIYPRCATNEGSMFFAKYEKPRKLRIIPIKVEAKIPSYTKEDVLLQDKKYQRGKGVITTRERVKKRSR